MLNYKEIKDRTSGKDKELSTISFFIIKEKGN